MLHYALAVLLQLAPADQPAGHVVAVKGQRPFTVLGLLDLTGRQPLGNPPPGCPPKCVDPLLVGKVPPKELALLVLPASKDTQIESLGVVVLDQGLQKVLARTELVCDGCGVVLPPLPEPGAGYLFRLDAKAVEALAGAYGQHPAGLRIDVRGKGEFRLALARLE
jgi:hypothetical protein